MAEVSGPRRRSNRIDGVLTVHPNASDRIRKTRLAQPFSCRGTFAQTRAFPLASRLAETTLPHEPGYPMASMTSPHETVCSSTRWSSAISIVLDMSFQLRMRLAVFITYVIMLQVPVPNELYCVAADKFLLLRNDGREVYRNRFSQVGAGIEIVPPN